jgi:hypothetical protein
VNLFVDTRVWSLAWRRDAPADSDEVGFLARALAGEGMIFTEQPL